MHDISKTYIRKDSWMGEINDIRDEQVFKDYYHRYYKILVIYALKMVTDESVAKDIVQDVFMALLRVNKTFDNELMLRAYLYSSARNKSMDYLKHKAIEQGFANKVMEQTRSYSVNSEGEEDFFSEEIYRRLFVLVDALPTRQRDVFVKLMEGKKLREIAEELNISFETVRTQKTHGLDKLRRQMNPEMIALLMTMIG